MVATVGEGSRAAGALRWARTHGVELAFGAVVVASMAYWMRVTGGSWFFADDWVYALQMRRPSNIVDAYNGHLSLTILAIYRVLLGVFGFSTYTPFRLAGIISLAGVAVAMFLYARRLVGPTVAALMGLVLLWMRGISMEPGGLNHSLALIGGIVCAAGLSGRGRRRDVLTGAGLTFALCSAGGGVAVAAGALLHSACTRARWTRWVAVVGPTLAWVLWWVTKAPPDSPALVKLRPDLAHQVSGAVKHAVTSFDYLFLGNHAVGIVGLVVFLGYGIWLLRHGLDASANYLGWTGALLAWWLGLERSRGFFLDGLPTFRYQLVSVAFIMLAVQPRRRVSWAGLATLSRGRVALSAAGTLLVALVLVTAVRPDVERFARQQAGYARLAKGRAATLVVGPGAVPDSTLYRLDLGFLTARQIRADLSSYGEPAPFEHPDQVAVDVALVSLADLPPEASAAPCVRPTRSRMVPPNRAFALVSTTGSPLVEVRRFDRVWTPVGRLGSGRPATLVLPDFGSTKPWQIRAPGVCVGPAR